MIISHRHRFIFIHCRKVAGSSIAAYLAQWLGPDDLMVDSWNDALRAGATYNRRFVRDLMTPRGLSEAFRWGLTDLKRGRLPSRRNLNRAYFALYDGKIRDRAKFATAANLRRWAPWEWRTYFKFCFVRNPYAKAVSDYHWRTSRRGAKHISFTEFLRRVNNPGRPDPEKLVSRPKDNWPLYTIDDEVAVDWVGRLETFARDFETVCNRIGIPFEKSRIPHAKGRPNGSRNYRSCYADGDVGLAYAAYRKEIDHFGYSF